MLTYGFDSAICAYSDAYSDSSTPLLLPPFFPKYYTVVPVANDIAYNITVVYRYSSQEAHGTDRPVLGMRSIGCSSAHLLLKLLLIYGSVFVSSSLRLPPSVHVNLPWGNLCPLPLSMQRSAVKPEAHT